MAQDTRPEESKMSLSHLLIEGYVEEQVSNDIFVVRFKSLSAGDMLAIDRAVALNSVGGDQRPQAEDRNIKYVAYSILFLGAKDSDGNGIEDDLGSLSIDKREEYIRDLPTPVFNSIFRLYNQFEKNTEELLKGVEAKNS